MMKDFSQMRVGDIVEDVSGGCRARVVAVVAEGVKLQGINGGSEWTCRAPALQKFYRMVESGQGTDQRAEFAGMALIGILASPACAAEQLSAETVADRAVTCADALIERLNRATVERRP